MRTERIVKKSESDLKTPKKISSDKYTRKEIDDLVIRLAEAHGIL